jgi:predicted DNA-binding transcriptional regulator YafY
LTGLNETDVRTLLLSGVPRPLADLGLDKALEAALLKLIVALPSARRQDAERARQRLHLDTAAWNAPGTEEVPHLRILQEAVWQERKVQLTYRRKDQTTVERLVSPLGLVAKTSIWYVVGMVEGEIRAYRVSRVQTVTLTDETFERPEDFDLAAYWADWCRQFRASLPQYRVTLRIAPEGVPILPQVFGESAQAMIAQADPPDAEGWVTIRPTFETIEAACTMVLGFGTLVEVLEPLELRERVIHQAASVVAFYAAKG